MRYPILITTVLIGLYACNTNDNSDRNPSNEQLVINYIDSLSKMSLGETFMGTNYMHYGPGITDSLTKQEWLKLSKVSLNEDFYLMRFEKYSIYSQTIKDGKMKGDWVLVWGKLTGRFLADRPIITIWYSWNFKIENNKIIEERVIFDNLDVLKQEGYKINIEYDSMYTVIMEER
jgi:hypothetical protein